MADRAVRWPGRTTRNRTFLCNKIACGISLDKCRVNGWLPAQIFSHKKYPGRRFIGDSTHAFGRNAKQFRVKREYRRSLSLYPRRGLYELCLCVYTRVHSDRAGLSLSLVATSTSQRIHRQKWDVLKAATSRAMWTYGVPNSNCYTREILCLHSKMECLMQTDLKHLKFEKESSK